MSVVELFELVKVHRHQANGLASAAGDRPTLAQRFLPAAAIAQSGERIGEHHLQQGALLFGFVAALAAQAYDVDQQAAGQYDFSIGGVGWQVDVGRSVLADEDQPLVDDRSFGSCAVRTVAPGVLGRGSLALGRCNRCGAGGLIADYHIGVAGVSEQAALAALKTGGLQQRRAAGAAVVIA